MYHSSSAGESISGCARDWQIPPKSLSPLGKNKNKQNTCPRYQDPKLGKLIPELRWQGLRRDCEVREVSCRLKCEGPTSLVCVPKIIRKPLIQR